MHSGVLKWIMLYAMMPFICLKGQDMLYETNENTLEKYIDNKEGNTDYSDFVDMASHLSKHPVNLNTARKEELEQISLLTMLDIEHLLEHRLRYGQFNSLYELQVIDQFDPEKIHELLPYITIKEMLISHFRDTRFLKSYQQQIILSGSRRMEKSKGYDVTSDEASAFQGNPYRYVMRYKASFSRYISWGFGTEKDNGERITNGFISPYLQITLPTKIKQLIIGDFQAGFGQGLCFGSGLSFGKSAFVLDIMKRQNGLKVNRAFNENELLRGIGSSVQLSKTLIWTSFFSQKNIDAAILEDSVAGFTSLMNTGNYRNENELSNKDALKRQIIGSNMSWQNGQLKIGVTGIYSRYGQKRIADPALYRLYDDAGSVLYNLGADYQYAHRNILFLGEVAMNGHIQTLSGLNGMIASLGKNLDISLLYRYYSPHYTAAISGAFGETQDCRNETGLYMAFSLVPYKHYKLNAYSDIYYFRWLRYQVDAPSKGSDVLLELQYGKRKVFSWYIRYRKEEKLKNEPGLQVMNRMDQQCRSSLRFHMEITVNSVLTLKSRVEQIWYKSRFSATTQGMLIFQDLQTQLHPRIKLISRLMFFDVEDYNSRVYAYENDMPLSFSVPAFQNKGTRFYMLLKYKINKNLYLCYRFARTFYDNVEITGSGQDTINSNKTTDTGIQLQWTL